MIHLIIISAIALAIGIGYRTKINIGLLAIAFSYLIATTLMGLSPKELLHFWPTSLFFTILASLSFITLQQLTALLMFWLNTFSTAHAPTLTPST